MKFLKTIEIKLGELLVRDLPAMPVKTKKLVVKYLPSINLVLGLGALFAAESFKRWADSSNSATNCANSLGAIYGGPIPSLAHISIAIWIGLIALLGVALFFLAAWRDTSFQRISGWYFMFYALLLAVLYSVVILFTSYGIGYTAIGLIASIAGLYAIFQIRSSYIKD